MKTTAFLSRALACTAASIVLVGPALAQSDSCAGATPITNGTYTGTTVGSTIDGTSDCGYDGPDVWFSYTAAASGILLLDTCGSLFDTILSVHDACPGHLGTLVACNDDATCGGPGGTLQSRLNVPVQAGRTYRVRLAGFGTDVGAYTLNVGWVPAGPSQTCEAAVPVGEGTYTGSTTGAASEGAVPSCHSLTSPDVWYAFTAPRDGTLAANTCGSTFDTILSVKSDCAGADLACNDDGCSSGFGSAVWLPVYRDVTYRIRVGGFGGDSGAYTLNIGFEPTAQTTCYLFTLIHEGVYTGSTVGHVNEGAQTTCGTSGQSPDVWYTYVPGATGTAVLTTCGSDFDTVLSVHSDCPGSADTTLICNDDGPCGGPSPQRQSRVSLPVVSGERYRVRISGYNGAAGNYILTVTENGCPADWNQDGTVNSGDVSAFLTTWLASLSGGTLAADFNGDAQTNSADISAFLTAWLGAVNGGC